MLDLESTLMFVMLVPRQDRLRTDRNGVERLGVHFLLHAMDRMDHESLSGSAIRVDVSASG